MMDRVPGKAAVAGLPMFSFEEEEEDDDEDDFLVESCRLARTDVHGYGSGPDGVRA